MRTVDQAVGGLGVALVGRPHDFRGPLVPVTAAQCEESAQGLRVHWGVSPVAVSAALGRREDAGIVVVADRLCGQPVFTGKVYGPH